MDERGLGQAGRCFIADTHLEECLTCYNERRKQLATTEPNEAHRLIADLEKDYDVTVITQNVDDLHERAGSTDVLHLHGELTKVCSKDHRWDPRYVSDYPLTTPIHVGDTAGDGAQLRPYVVLFGEQVPGIILAADTISRADILVVVGTSLTVYPAACLINEAPDGIPRYIIDPNDMPKCNGLGFTHLKAKASEGMRQLTDQLKDR